MRNEIPKDRVGNGLGGLILVKFQLLDNKWPLIILELKIWVLKNVSIYMFLYKKDF